jgi:filamentous hemagglutinin
VHDIETKAEINKRESGGYYVDADGKQQSVKSPYPNDGTTVQQNRVQGKEFEKLKVDEFKKNKTDVVEQVTVETNSGNRAVIYIMTKDSNGKIGCHECKSSATAPLTKGQTKSYPEIENGGAIVVGKGKPGFEGGTLIPPTKVEIIRPE